MKNNLSYNIIAGEYKGRKLFLPSLSSTRATKNRVRESFFNTVAFDIDGKIFVEVFGGSGSMGLEAVSRGVKHSYFIEKDREAYRVLKKNCELINPNSTTAILGDSFCEFQNILSNLAEETIFYFDPPFEIRDGMEDIYKKTEDLIKHIPQSIAFLIAIEHRTKQKMAENIGEYQKSKTKKFGNSSITYYKKVKQNENSARDF